MDNVKHVIEQSESAFTESLEIYCIGNLMLSSRLSSRFGRFYRNRLQVILQNISFFFKSEDGAAGFS